MNKASNCCATSFSASGDAAAPARTPCFRLFRPLKSRAEGLPWLGRGMYCTNAISGLYDFQVGAQGTRAFQVLQYGQQLLGRSAQRVQGLDHVGQVGAGGDRKSVVEGQRVSERVGLGVRRIIQNKITNNTK